MILKHFQKKTLDVMDQRTSRGTLDELTKGRKHKSGNKVAPTKTTNCDLDFTFET